MGGFKLFSKRTSEKVEKLKRKIQKSKDKKDKEMSNKQKESEEEKNSFINGNRVSNLENVTEKLNSEKENIIERNLMEMIIQKLNTYSRARKFGEFLSNKIKAQKELNNDLKLLLSKLRKVKK